MSFDTFDSPPTAPSSAAPAAMAAGSATAVLERPAPTVGAPVTPEGVLLDLETAGVASRLLARALDLLICAVALYAVLIALAVMTPPLWVMFVAVTIAVFVALFVYPVVLETMLRGRTVGKIATGLRVVTDIGAPIRFRHAATRSALSVVDLLATSGFAGIVSMIMSPRHQRLGDLAAGTVVLRTRSVSGAGERRPVATPDGYESFVTSLDTARL
ncbi:MAG: RDD family protein, partial [Actinomycetota bacterium]|nr:RDD family protein [Actinomycetota bacterium]